MCGPGTKRTEPEWVKRDVKRDQPVLWHIHGRLRAERCGCQRGQGVEQERPSSLRVFGLTRVQRVSVETQTDTHRFEGFVTKFRLQPL